MATELIDDELESELNIDDTDAADDKGADDQDNDRGDDFVDPEAIIDEKAQGEELEKDDDPPADDKAKPDGVPIGRLNEVSRIKSAATAIADGVVDGEISPQTIKDLGGASAVAKAIANRELTLEDLKNGAPGAVQQPAAQAVNTDPNSPSNWNLDEKFVEYQEMVDAGETKEAAALLRQIGKEERARERAEEQVVAKKASLQEYISQMITAHPTLNDPKHPDHHAVKDAADLLQIRQGLDRATALSKAIEKVMGGRDPGASSDQPGEVETTQQRVIRERREAANRKKAIASGQQPPPMGLGATPSPPGKPKDISRLTEEQFAQLTPEEKARERGDYL